jgi:hypothetical protein
MRIRTKTILNDEKDRAQVRSFIPKILYHTNVVARRVFALPDEAIPCFKGYFSSKGDCFAAKVQERRLATTSIHKMYGRESKNMLIFIILTGI